MRTLEAVEDTCRLNLIAEGKAGLDEFIECLDTPKQMRAKGKLSSEQAAALAGQPTRRLATHSEARHNGRMLAAGLKRGLSVKELAIKHNISTHTVRNRINRSDTSVQEIQQEIRAEKDEIAGAMYLNGASIADIAKEVHLSLATISRVLRQKGIPTRKEEMDEAISEIAKKYQGGSVSEFAKKNGLSPMAISRRLKGYQSGRNGWPSKGEIADWILAYNEGTPLEDIKTKYQIQTVRKHLKIAGLSARSTDQINAELNKKYHEERRLAAVRLRKDLQARLNKAYAHYDSGATLTESAVMAKTSAQTLRVHLVKLGMYRPAIHTVTSPADRFWMKVEKGESCWLWTGSTDRDGYGCSVPKGLGKRAHRASWTLTHGEIPKGMQVLHTCDNPPCVNPDHLFLGTHKINMWDKSRKGRSGKKPKRLTPKEVREIRTAYAEGDTSYAKLSGAYQVDKGTVMNCVRRNTYKNIQ